MTITSYSHRRTTRPSGPIQYPSSTASPRSPYQKVGRLDLRQHFSSDRFDGSHSDLRAGQVINTPERLELAKSIRSLSQLTHPHFFMNVQLQSVEHQQEPRAAGVAEPSAEEGLPSDSSVESVSSSE